LGVAANRVFALQEGKIIRSQLRSEIATAIATTDKNFQLIANEPIVLNAEYVESGRRINNGDEIPLQEFEVPELRDLKVEIPGVLDG
jgi:hypothetical protein